MKNDRKINIAIDGPSGAGKSTISKFVAKETGFLYVDTGAMYRAVGLYMRRAGIEPADTQEVIAALPAVKVELKHIDGTQHVFLNSEDVNDSIREHEISQIASDVSKIPEVRTFLLDMQRDIAKNNDVIMDGRDIGTVILPDAQIKIYLTATPEDRAKRRQLELIAQGTALQLEQVIKDIKLRDQNDMNRKDAPLKKADDAILIDTTGNTYEQSAQLILDIINVRLKKRED